MSTRLSLCFRYQDKTSLLQAIGNLTYLRGQTDTAEALRDLIDKVFGASGGVRTGIANTTIIVTDGVPTKDVDQVPLLAKEAQEKGIRILVVGVGDAVNTELLSNIASEPKEVRSCWKLIITYCILKLFRAFGFRFAQAELRYKRDRDRTFVAVIFLR